MSDRKTVLAAVCGCLVGAAGFVAIMEAAERKYRTFYGTVLSPCLVDHNDRPSTLAVDVPLENGNVKTFACKDFALYSKLKDNCGKTLEFVLSPDLRDHIPCILCFSHTRIKP